MSKIKYFYLCFNICLLFSCTKNDYIVESEIASEILLTRKLNLSNYNDFAWDSIMIVHPYSNIEKIEETKKLNLSYVSKSIESKENINLLIFLKNSKAVKTCELERRYGNFKGAYNMMIPKNKANFYLTGYIYPKNPAELHLNKNMDK